MERTRIGSLVGMSVLTASMLHTMSKLVNEALYRRLVLGGAVMAVELALMLYGFWYLFQLLREDGKKVNDGELV